VSKKKEEIIEEDSYSENENEAYEF